MFQFHSKEYLWLLLVLPVFALLWWLAGLSRKRSLKAFGDSNVVSLLMPGVSVGFRNLKIVLLLMAFAMLVLALARPRFGSSLLDVKRNGIELIVAIDVSNSMLTRDVKPNRLERAKKGVEKLIAELENDRIGLIIFAGDSYLQLPVTNDYASARMFLRSISPALAPKQGTAIGSAIEMATRSYTSGDQMSKVLVIFTDGENHEDDPVGAAKEAYEKGIIIHTVGMGLPNGQPVPMPDGNGFMKDRSGNVVMSKLDELSLQQIASAAHGIYVRTGSSNTGIELIANEISKMQQSTITSRQYADYDEKFVYPAALALLFLVLGVLLPERKTIRQRKIDLFKVND